MCMRYTCLEVLLLLLLLRVMEHKTASLAMLCDMHIADTAALHAQYQQRVHHIQLPVVVLALAWQ
jgi:hypothetical protein